MTVSIGVEFGAEITALLSSLNDATYRKESPFIIYQFRRRNLYTFIIPAWALFILWKGYTKITAIYKYNTMVL